MIINHIQPNSRRVGAFDAKTHLSQLLSEVEKGSTIEITRRGKIVACLVSPDELKSQSAFAALERATERRKKINSRERVTLTDILEYRNEGRK
ncbi:MAG TPA: hypothetical protein DCO79_02855 [Spirochaeta sp.]|nr:hypothetical protein [Spirochaeta sp.]